MTNIRTLCIALALALGLCCEAAAQAPPYVYPITIGTTSTQVLASGNARKRLIFINPNATAKVAVCPSGPSRNTGTTVTAVINGAGCTTILPYSSFTVDGGISPGPTLSMPSPWVAIADTPGSALTIYEFE